MIILSTLMVGLVLGGTYALVALGLTIQYGISRIMNLAYGEIVITGSFLTYVLFSQFNINPLLALFIVVPIGYLGSYIIYAVLMQPLVTRSSKTGTLEVDTILVTFGLMFLAQGVLLLIFGSNFIGYSYMEYPINILGVKIAASKIIGFVLAVVLGSSLYYIIAKTRWGMCMRAVSTRPEFAQLVGIDVKKYSRVAFAMGGALAAAGGVILSMYQPFTATFGAFFTMKALIIVIMGGVGNLMGALIAGLIIGVVEVSVSVAFDPGLKLAAVYVIFLAVLLLRPSGIFGKGMR